ncbi:MAG: hypothetical protein LBJ00_16065 [Planctomycetaceae bacterium]|jgi:arylsulfatase A-like enzyme|nr:hypothetical protein [Planctomycetaceae bacterium]
MSVPSQNLICISIDGLHSGMVGLYGNTWIQTPSFDSLAVQSVVFDKYYAASVNLADNFDLLWKDSWLEQFARNNGNTILVTDDSDIFNHANAYFTRKYMIEASADEIADKPESTNFFKIFATIIDLAQEQKTNQPDQQYCIWAHLRGFRGVWDFPISYRECHREEEDPYPYDGFRLPEFSGFDPDQLQSVMEAYSGGMLLLDDVLSGLVEVIDVGELGGQTVLAIFGTRGFSLGEHKKIGANYDLFGENIQLPLIVRLPDNTGATVRVLELLNPDDLADFLISVTKNQIDTSKIFQLARENKIEQHELLQIKGNNDEVALVTPNWFVRRSGGQVGIYVKPDDRWEVNDVSNRLNENQEIIALLEKHKPYFDSQ